MTDFLPPNYKEPVGNYMKFEQGENTFRVMSSAIVGYEYWTNSGLCIRVRQEPTSTPDIRVQDGKTDRVKHFWAFVVWNAEAGKLQILEITQAGIRSAIKAYVGNKKWGDPKGYDITISKTGSGLDTEYTVMANPHTPVDPAAAESMAARTINLEALFKGEDPFGGASEEATTKDTSTGEVAAEEEYEGMGDDTPDDVPAAPVSPVIRKPKSVK